MATRRPPLTAILFALSCAHTSAPPALPERPAPLSGAGLPPRTVVFTFDDGPDELTLPIARYLASAGIAATFFVNGKRFCHYVDGKCTAVTGSCPLTGDHWKNRKLYDE